MIPSFLVTGTDTGVGKTLVSGALAAELARRHLPVGVMKPFATGARSVRGRLVSEDARFLKAAAGVDDPLDLINPICLKPPLAPSMAAEVARKPIDLDKVWSAYTTLCARHSTLILEGVGGLLVPLLPGLTVADLAQKMRLPLLIVTRPSLGTLNHTALTVHVARSYGLSILGLVVNASQPARRGLAERLNPGALERFTRVPVLGEVPYFGPRLARTLRHPVFRRIVDRLDS
ncbi:MAG TPA: dethiobiotin synthase [Planctomycetota bacterium]|nr:dethiobiotin synthase [Planctomycetota bacterium]